MVKNLRKKPFFKLISDHTLYEGVNISEDRIMRIYIKDYLGPFDLTKEDVQKFYDVIHEALQDSETITLDFEKHKYSSYMFEMVFRNLCYDFRRAELRR